MAITVTDNRQDGPGFPIAKYQFTQQSWAAAASTATTEDIKINGTIVAVEVIASDSANAITYTVALETSNGASVFSVASIAENAKTWLDARSHKGTQDADFNPVPVNDTLTATFTPSGVPGTGGSTLDVILYVE